MPDSTETMTETSARLSPNNIRVLQALRAGPMQPDELSERMNGKYTLAGLLRLGYIESTAMGYKITEAGRAACPSRRSTERLDVGSISLAQDASAPEKRVSTINIYDAARIVQQLGELKPSFQIKKQEATMTEPDKNIKPKALQILEYIEAHPGSTNLDISLGTGISPTQAYLKYHIKNGKVIIMNNGPINTFKLADGLTADCIYFNTKRKPRTNKAEITKPEFIEPWDIPYYKKLRDDEFASAASVDEKIGDFAQAMQEISQENAAADELQKPEAKVLKLDLPQRIDAEFCIKTLLKLMPHSHVIKIRKASDGSGIAEIDGRTLAEQIAPDIADIDVTLSALNTINQAMPA